MRLRGSTWRRVAGGAGTTMPMTGVASLCSIVGSNAFLNLDGRRIREALGVPGGFLPAARSVKMLRRFRLSKQALHKHYIHNAGGSPYPVEQASIHALAD